MSVTRLVYEVNATGDHYIDLAKDLSIINRKLIRQKQIFTVMGGIMHDSQGAQMEFLVAPHTWTTKLAINRAFKQWRKLQSQTYKRNEGLRAPKWNDFKVYLDSLHNTGRLLTPIYAPNRPHSEGEWNYATLTQPKLIDSNGDGELGFDANADQWELQIVGEHTVTGSTVQTSSGQTLVPNYTRVGMIKSWYDSRAVPDTQVPDNTPDTRMDPLSNLFDIEDDDSEHAAIIEGENDTAPYDYNRVQGAGNGETQIVSIADNSAGEPDVTTIPGFQAICGLIKINVSSENNFTLILDVQTEGERF